MTEVLLSAFVIFIILIALAMGMILPCLFVIYVIDKITEPKSERFEENPIVCKRPKDIL